MSKQQLIEKLAGKTVILCKNALKELDQNLFYNLLLEKQNYKYYKLHFVNKTVEYTYANSFDAVKDIPPSKYDFLTSWAKKELQKWVDFIDKK